MKDPKPNCEKFLLTVSCLLLGGFVGFVEGQQTFRIYTEPTVVTKTIEVTPAPRLESSCVHEILTPGQYIVGCDDLQITCKKNDVDDTSAICSFSPYQESK